MRIISGAYRGKILKAPKKLKVRPTTDYAKTGLFNILNNRIDFDETTLLDLFAGIGSISFEFFSRGTTHITAVDKNIGCTKFLDDVADEINAEGMEILTMDSFRYIELCKHSFDLIFADPPYDHPRTNDLLPAIIQNKLLNKNGLFILEHSSRKKADELTSFTETRKYGEVSFSFYHHDE